MKEGKQISTYLHTKVLEAVECCITPLAHILNLPFGAGIIPTKLGRLG